MNSSSSTSNCSSYDLSIYVAIGVAACTANFISLLANFFVLFFIVIFKRWGFFNLRLIFYLSLATVIGNVAGILASVGYENETGDTYDRFCMFAGFLYQITGWMLLNSYVCITASMLIKAFFTINMEKLDVATVLIIFAFPIIINWIPFVLSGYGKSAAWCWIKSIKETCENDHNGQILQLILWYAPVYTILGVLILMYSLVVIMFCRNRRKWRSDPQINSEKRQALRYIISLLAYPVIYFAANIFPLINRLYGFSDSQGFVPALWFLAAISYQLQGLAIAVAFLSSIKKKLNRVSVKAAFREWFHKVRIEEYSVGSGTLERSLNLTHQETKQNEK